jgi:hypothetical protein
VYLWLAALCLGAGLGIHATLVMALPPALVLLWTDDQRRLHNRTLLPALALFTSGLGLYAYLPWAASHDPPVNWGNPDNWERFFWMVGGKLYQPLVFGLPPGEWGPRLGSWIALIGNQFGWWGLGIALIGAPAWWKHDRRLALFALLWALLVTLYAFFYGSPDSFVYLMPALLLLAVSWGHGARHILDVAGSLRPWVQPAASAALLLLPLGSLVLHWGETDLSHDWSAQTYVDRVLAATSPNGLVLVRGEIPTFGLWYARHAEGRRPDIAVVNTSLFGFGWYRAVLRQTYELEVPEPGTAWEDVDSQVRELVIRNYLSHPIYATDPSDALERWFALLGEPDGLLYQVKVRVKWEPAR